MTWEKWPKTSLPPHCLDPDSQRHCLKHSLKKMIKNEFRWLKAGLHVHVDLFGSLINMKCVPTQTHTSLNLFISYLYSEKKNIMIQFRNCFHWRSVCVSDVYLPSKLWLLETCVSSPALSPLIWIVNPASLFTLCSSLMKMKKKLLIHDQNSLIINYFSLRLALEISPKAQTFFSSYDSMSFSQHRITHFI